MTAPPATRPQELRLTMRVLALWREASAGNAFPRPADIVAERFGVDWNNCVLIRVDPAIERSSFLFIGDGLFLGSPRPLEGRPVTACEPGTLLHSATVYLPDVVTKRIPISIGGPGTHHGVPILYRSMLMPLSSDGTVIDGALGAANCREVRASHEEHSPEVR